MFNLQTKLWETMSEENWAEDKIELRSSENDVKMMPEERKSWDPNYCGKCLQIFLSVKKKLSERIWRSM